MPEVPESALDSCVSPPGVLSGHTDRQLCDDLHDPGSPRGSTLVGPLLGHELPVATEDSVGRDERSNFGESAPSNSLAPHGQSAALIVGQAESSSTELLLQDSILLAEILDDRILLTGDPAGQGGDEDLPRSENGGHRRIVLTP